MYYHTWLVSSNQNYLHYNLFDIITILFLHFFTLLTISMIKLIFLIAPCARDYIGQVYNDIKFIESQLIIAEIQEYNQNQAILLLSNIMYIIEKDDFISLLPKNMEEMIKEAIYKKYEQIEQDISYNDGLQLNIREIIKDIFESNIIDVHAKCFLIQKALDCKIQDQIFNAIIDLSEFVDLQEYFKHLLDQSLSEIIVISVITSLKVIGHDRSVIHLNILGSLFKLLKRTKNLLTLGELFCLIVEILYKKPSFIVEQKFINHLIHQINEDVEEQDLNLAIVRNLTEYLDHRFKLNSQLQSLIPHIVRNLISSKYEGQPFNIGSVIKIFLNVYKSVDELMKMHQLEIVGFVDFIVSSAHSPLIDDIAHCVIIKMACNNHLSKIILEKGHLDKVGSDLHTSQISRYIDFILKISERFYYNPVFAEILTSSIAFKLIFCEKQAVQLFIHNSQIDNGCKIFQIMTNMFNYRTNTITLALIQSSMHDFLSVLLFEQGYLLQETGLCCLVSLFEERRRIAYNCDEYEDEKYSYFRSQKLQDLTEKVFKFLYKQTDHLCKIRWLI